MIQKPNSKTIKLPLRAAKIKGKIIINNGKFCKAFHPGIKNGLYHL